MRWALALAGVLLACASVAEADVGEYMGRPVSAVRFEIEGTPAIEPRLAAVVLTRVGEPLSLVSVRETIVHLLNLGRFDDVIVDASAEPGGVSLTYRLTPVHPVEEFLFSGAEVPEVGAGRLRRLVRERFGASPPAARADEIARFVDVELQARGYLRPRVQVSVAMEHDPHRSVMAFAIDPGARTRVGDLQVTGNAGVTPAVLLDRLQLRSGEPYEPEALIERIASYLERQRDDGRFLARLTTSVRFEDEDRLAHVTLVADQGPRVRVEFAGDAIPGGRTDDLVPIESEGSVSEDVLEDARLRIEDALRSQGYRDASATSARRQSEDELLVTFTIARGPQYRLASDVEISGNDLVPLSELTPFVQLRAGQPFIAASLDATVDGIRETYRRRGFTQVQVQPGEDPVPASVGGENLVIVRIVIAENIRTLVRQVRVEGNTVPQAQLLEGLGLSEGAAYDVATLTNDLDLVRRRYGDLGFHRALVTPDPSFSDDGTRVDIVYRVNEGPPVAVQHVVIVGNDRTRESTIARELTLSPGEAIGLTDLLDMQQRLATLGLFRRVRVGMLDHGEDRRRDLLVTVEEAPATTVGYGGGVELAPRIRASESEGGAATEQIEFAPRAFFELTRRNLFGKNRSVSLFTSIGFLPESDVPEPGVPAEDTSPFGFVEYRVLGTFQEPRVFGTQADAVISIVAEQQARSSFNFWRQGITAGIGRPLTRTVRVAGSYELERTKTFDEQFTGEDALLIDRAFPQVRLSSFAGSVIRDTRDDQLNPLRGRYLSGNAQVAARAIGSEVGFLKTFLTGQLFHPIGSRRRLVFAASARVGMAVGFPRDLIQTDGDGNPILGPDGQPVVDTIEDLPASERFFAGGATTVRGFALDQLGTPETIDSNGFPIGGNAVTIFNAELRVPLLSWFGFVGFVDAGNVFARTSDINLGEIRGAVGIGARFVLPFGPIRVDLGFKTDRRDITPGNRESLTALHISLGQAF